MSDDAAFQDWIERAKAAPIMDVANMLGARLKRAGTEFAGPCPAGCAKDDGFAINPKKGVFLCRPGGAQGSSIDMVIHVNGGDFMQACEFINGEPPPRGESRPHDHDAQRERERDQRERDRRQDEANAQDQVKKRSAAEQWWDASVPIEGTHAHAYLKARGLDPSPSQTINLGFMASAPLYGTEDDPETGRPVKIGNFPCMIAAMRGLDGTIIGAHRTYLDPHAPRRLVLSNGEKQAKKLIGEAGGGAIWLGEPQAVVAIAEGIETALSWGAMWDGGAVGLCAAYSLGNMAGAAQGTRPHPTQKRTIPNGVPDMARPGVRLPPIVQEVILLGDGDSDPATTRAHLLTGGRRFRLEGLQAVVSMAPPGLDWNDSLLEFLRQRPEAA